MKVPRVQPRGRSEGHRSKKPARSTTTDAARHPRFIAAIGTVVFVPSRGRFRVNITAPIVIRMATITGDMAGIAIDLVDSFEARRIVLNIASGVDRIGRARFAIFPPKNSRPLGL
jgi:hypothetical protein